MAAALSGRRAILAATCILICAVARSASAQYFGQNKVQYRTFTFQVLQTEHFDIHYYPEEREGVDIAARLAERWHARLERLFEHRLRGRQPLILYASHPDFEQTNVIGGELGEGTGGVTEGLRRRIVLPLGGPIADTDHVIGHELVHAFQFDLTTTPEMGPGQNGASRLPLWFIEGMAEYLSLGPVDPHTAMWLRDAARQDRLPALRDLNNPKYFPYRWGQAFWAYVGGRWGDGVIGEMLLVAAAVSSPEAAFERVLGITSADLSRAWQASIREAYAPVLEATTHPGIVGRVAISGKALGDELNVGPAISPDGRRLAFLSGRGYFSIDLYIAETSTGRITHKLTSTATNPHYSSLQFIHSAGAWDRTGERIVIATVTAGRPALAIFAAGSGKKERDIAVPRVDEIFSPTWAPDGRAIAFSGMTRGLTDLFVYDLVAGTLRQLTTDAYADLQPAWSPDGTRIAFATDRYSSNLRSLEMGPYRLALVDPRSGRIEPVAGFASGKQLDPQWSPDGRSLYFVADPEGLPDIYRVSLAEGALAQVTTVVTGVSGITSSSPAMSVASRSGTIAFSVYESGKYSIATLDAPAAGTAPRTLTMNAGVLPPMERVRSEVAELLADPTFGLQEPQPYPSTPYEPRLSLEAAGEPMVGVGVSRFGPTIGGGMTLYFGDLLGNRQLATGVGVMTGSSGNISAKDIAAQAAFLDQSRRWNWGGIGGQIPYVSSGYSSGVGRTSTGELVGIDQLFTFRQTEQTAAGLVTYPFDRSRRIEFQGGFSHISFDRIVDTTIYSLTTGSVYENTTESTSYADPLALATTSAAYVFDTTSFGATSPVQGQRYRLEANPTFGTIGFTGLLADYRRYFMPISFYTVGVRLMHYGRYGNGAEDPRLYPLSIGYPGLVRGYDVYTIDAADCVPSAANDCPMLDRLYGSRILVGNAELRFPLLRPLGLSRNMYGPIPVEVALFADSGTAWTSGQRPSWFGGGEGAVYSAGVTLRVNMLGFAIGQFDFVRPFQRPGRGWTYAFNLLQGW